MIRSQISTTILSNTSIGCTYPSQLDNHTTLSILFTKQWINQAINRMISWLSVEQTVPLSFIFYWINMISSAWEWIIENGIAHTPSSIWTDILCN